MIVYYINDSIVIKISISSVYQHVLTLYYLIQKPVYQDNSYCVYIKTNSNYLVVSRPKKLYLTHNERHVEQVTCQFLIAKKGDGHVCPKLKADFGGKLGASLLRGEV